MIKIYKLIYGDNVYVGQTTMKLNDRLRRHISRNPSLISYSIFLIEDVSENQADDRESYWIDYFRKSSMCCFNEQSGGRSNYSWSIDMVKRRSGSGNGMWGKTGIDHPAFKIITREQFVSLINQGASTYPDFENALNITKATVDRKLKLFFGVSLLELNKTSV